MAKPVTAARGWQVAGVAGDIVAGTVRPVDASEHCARRRARERAVCGPQRRVREAAAGVCVGGGGTRAPPLGAEG